MKLGEQQNAGWTVAQTNVGDEGIAEDAIFHLGYEPLVFRCRKLIRSHHRPGWRKGEFDLRPLILGYLFVLVTYGDPAYSIDRARGVRRFFRHCGKDGLPGKPRYVRAREIAGIRAAVDAGIYDDVKETGLRTDLKSGDAVRTPAGLAGQLVNLDEKGRADLMTMFMGAPRLVRGVEARTLELAWT